MQNRILIVVTSFEKYPTINRPTGLWLGEAVHFAEVHFTTGGLALGAEWCDTEA